MYLYKLEGAALTLPEELHELEREAEKEHDKEKDSLPPLIKRLAELQKAQEGLEILREGRSHQLIADRSHSDHDKHDNGHDAHSDHDAHDNHMDKG